MFKLMAYDHVMERDLEISHGESLQDILTDENMRRARMFGMPFIRKSN